jgi:hypothetical protein
MGHHKDSDTLTFIEWLRKKGKSLGYIVELEYPLLKTEYYVDVVWKLQKEQPPLATFEIETTEGREIFCNTAKIFGTSSKLVSKPWRHFMIIYKGKLSKGHKKSLFNVTNQNNVSLFEDVFGKPENMEKLEKELERLGYDVGELIKVKLQTKPLGESLPAILKGLSEGLSGGPLGEPEVSITFKAVAPPKGEKNFSILIETPKGQLTFYDKLKEASRTLKPFTIESPELKDLILAGQSVVPPGGGKAKLTIVPKPLIAPVHIVVPGTNVSFDVLLRRVKTEGSTAYLSTEDRNLPFTFEFNLDIDEKKGTFNSKFDPSHADVLQSFLYEQLIRALNSKKEIQVLDSIENKQILGFRIHQSHKQLEDPQYDLLSKLAHIQEKTKHVIPIPATITKEDIQDIYTIVRTIDTGENKARINEVKFTANKQWARKLYETMKKESKISGLKISQKTSCKLFNEIIPFGISEIKLPDMQFTLPLEKVEKLLEETEEKPISLTLRPIADTEVVIRFEDWLGKN